MLSPAGSFTVMSFGSGACGNCGFEVGVRVGRVVRLREGEVDAEARGLVGLDRAAALQRFGFQAGVELGGEEPGRRSRSPAGR